MTAFLGELGGRLADRWLSLLVLPGLLFVAAAGAAGLLGQRQALAVGPAERAVAAVSASAAAHSAGALVLIAAGVLAASAVAGLAGTLSGRCVELLWTMPGRRWPASRLAAWRLGRWERAQARELSGIRAAALAAYPPAGGPTRPAGPIPVQARSAITRRERIGLIRPERPTWIGDRLLAADQRVFAAYRLDLAAAWAALWLVIPDSARGELAAARDGYAAAARLAGWGILYAIIGAWWWPALVIAAAAGGTGWLRGRSSAGVLARLAEAAVDLYGLELAGQLGLAVPPASAGLDRGTGAAITSRLRKDPHVADASPASE